MSEIFGNVKGNKNSVLAELESLYSLEIDKANMVTQELCVAMAQLTNVIGREISLFIDRSGKVTAVSVGDSNTVTLPNMNSRRGESRLNGFRCIHTHPNGDSTLSSIDISALRLNRYDVMAAIGVANEAEKSQVSFAVLTGIDERDEFTVGAFGPASIEEAEQVFFPNLVATVERAIVKNVANKLTDAPERAIVVGMEYNGMGDMLGWTMDDSLEELKQLADTAGAEVVARFKQKRPKPDPAFFIGQGKVHDLALFAQAN
ncbi:MAG: GTPase HflX, partial [Phascolarctobacterium sp.]|nr:GTPase HflX [Candidatus Phascolarctobacterium equi]